MRLAPFVEVRVLFATILPFTGRPSRGLQRVPSLSTCEMPLRSASTIAQLQANVRPDRTVAAKPNPRWASFPLRAFIFDNRKPQLRCRCAVKLNGVKDTSVGRFATICITLFYVFALISGKAVSQEQFQSSLQENEHLWHANVKGVGCDTQFNRQPHNPDTALVVRCSILFADGSPDFRAALRFCPNFQTCDAAGGKFKDIVVAILRKKIREKGLPGARK